MRVDVTTTYSIKTRIVLVYFLLKTDHGLIDFRLCSQHLLVKQLTWIQLQYLCELFIVPWIELISIEIRVHESKRRLVHIFECEVLRVGTKNICFKFWELESLHENKLTWVSLCIDSHLLGNSCQGYLILHVSDHSLHGIWAHSTYLRCQDSSTWGR